MWNLGMTLLNYAAELEIQKIIASNTLHRIKRSFEILIERLGSIQPPQKLPLFEAKVGV